uniref:Uncharacterized protein n=1 Tax=Glossina palpalis gambiensis TaxID=67801 RepID=A0A1B0BFD5_9MUSC
MFSTHDLFKALLFIWAGAIIHNINNNQDIRLIVVIKFTAPKMDEIPAKCKEKAAKSSEAQ